MLPCPWSTSQHLPGNENICYPLLPGVNQLLLTGKEWPGGDGKGRLSSEGLAAFPGFATSSLEYPWPAHFTSVCLSLSGAAGSCPSVLCSHCPVSAGCPAHLILPIQAGDICRAQGKLTPLDLGIFSQQPQAGSSLPREFRRQEMVFCMDAGANILSVQTLGFWMLWVWDVGLKSWNWVNMAHWLPCLFEFKGLLIPCSAGFAFGSCLVSRTGVAGG